MPVPSARANASREIARTRESFLSSGVLKGAGLRPVIAERWRSCRERGVDPTLDRAPVALSPEDVALALARQDLGRAGRPVLDDFGRLVDGTGHVVVLADEAGRVLHATGHAGFQGTLERVNLAPGALWSEAAVGPNGIGTPLALGRPEMVVGAEHYCAGWQAFFCCGSPVRDPNNGRIVGAIDISGPVGKAHPMVFALTVSIARSVEQNLAVLGLERRSALLRLFRAHERRRPNEAVLLVDGRGEILELNASAAAALGTIANRNGVKLTELAPALDRPLREAFERGQAVRESVTLKAHGERELLASCEMEPIRIDGRTLGSLVVFSWQPRSSSRGSREVVAARTSRVPNAPSLSNLLGTAPALLEAIKLARAVAQGPHRKPVLILGESGTGKEVVAQAIHRESERAAAPFVAVNCGALPRDLVESELFGYAPGAFTGARREGQAGKFEAAKGGTIFLDEVDSMPLEVQAKLLRVIETGQVVRLGSASPVSLDLAIMAASSPDLRQRVEQACFRLDLFHRLSVVEILLPPLRERLEDLALLARAFLERECQEQGRPALSVSTEAMAALACYRWPGNVRELENLCARWAITLGGNVVRREDLPAHVLGNAPLPAQAIAGSLRGREDAIIRQTLSEAGGHVAEAARRLGINKTTIYRWLKRGEGPQRKLQAAIPVADCSRLVIRPGRRRELSK